MFCGSESYKSNSQLDAHYLQYSKVLSVILTFVSIILLKHEEKYIDFQVYHSLISVKKKDDKKITRENYYCLVKLLLLKKKTTGNKKKTQK